MRARQHTKVKRTVRDLDHDVQELGIALDMMKQLFSLDPRMILEMVEDMIVAGAKRKPDTDTIDMALMVLAPALEELRYGVEAKRSESLGLADELRAMLLKAHGSGRLATPLLHTILSQFAIAKLDIGDALRQAMLGSIRNGDVASTATEGLDIGKQLRQMLGDDVGNPFTVHAVLTEMAASIPDEPQAALALALMLEPLPSLSAAALGSILSPSAAVRRAVCERLGDVPTNLGAASPEGLRRMITLRNWLPVAERPALDAAIRKLRLAGVECAPWPSVDKVQAYASGFDGSGMQALFALVPEGKKWAVAAMIGRLGQGVRDAWVRHGLSRREANEMMAATNAQLRIRPVDTDYVAAAMRHFIAVNVDGGALPPFGLLEIAECTGLSSLEPTQIDTADLIEQLVRDIKPDRLTHAQTARALADSGSWPRQHEIFQSWFVDSDASAKLATAPRQSRDKRVTAVLAMSIAKECHLWAQLLAWTAFAAKHRGGSPQWQDLAIVARAVATGHPVDEIPILRRIAEQTVDYLA